MRSKPAASSLQKTYDECYLSCSTAVYFEGQNNEDEALRAWRSALDTISYHNAYRLSSTYTPKNETEKALQDSIRQLELQCRERVDLLEALRESRKESQEKESSTISSARDRLFKGKSAAKSPTSNPPGWIGDGTVPAVGYTDLSRPPPIPRRPGPVTQTSSESFANDNSAASATSSPAIRIQSHSSGKSPSRNSSPEKRKIMPTTLRKSDGHRKYTKAKDALRRKELRPAASQAAGLAWGSVYRSPSSSGNLASDAALTSSRNSLSSDSGFRRDPGHFRSSSGDDRSPRKIAKEDLDSRESPVRPRAPRRTTSSTIAAQTSTLNRHSPAGEARQQSGSRVAAPTQPVLDPFDARQRSPTRPSVKPKPVALRVPAPSPPTHNINESRSPARKVRSEGTKYASENPQSKPTSRSRINASPSVRPGPRATDGDLSPAVSRMAISDTPLRRQPQPAHTVTPPSSDQESSGLKSIDADEEEEDEDEDRSISDIMKKLPKGIDANAARQILNDIVVRGDEVHWDDIAGLDPAKKALKEAVVYPFLRPDLFSGLREPARGMLLFGPPGTGKTMLARAVATESKSTFFSVSASTLTSKWHGESEKLVRALFGLAKVLAPSIIFVDEIDSLLSARSSGTEHEASRRSKTEFLIQWSDLQRAAAGREPSTKKTGGDASRVLVLAATNMPWDIDEAARRRFVRRQYIPLPEHHVREQQLRKLLSHQNHDLNDEDIEVLVHVTEGFSGSDITALAKDAAMGPLRNLGEALLHTPMDQIRPIRFQDFEASLKSIRPSVSRDGLQQYEEWAQKFGERGG
ncbi:putative AAA family ATPase [Aspergillus clavatus NRRL 1]|uniref:AAA family ATPase, putative n=1 Tax=Aspergillus clavatus (strain ATCC 1007 / CBS 513.65 / DSM 816 / NCTC 3887 / NRRL 1 / QM 1276 / 107) TaxID=344612 RepID=A1CU97_ASPCL|nr:AAA family ATPase, putative [Aspergillus clavatus NRRL 1]EAW06884.1 AAA family ATPase, putative [Aspergillus clavatus NRRL 1]